jgi:hypothetical protein
MFLDKRGRKAHASPDRFHGKDGVGKYHDSQADIGSDVESLRRFLSHLSILTFLQEIPTAPHLTGDSLNEKGRPLLAFEVVQILINVFLKNAPLWADPLVAQFLLINRSKIQIPVSCLPFWVRQGTFFSFLSIIFGGKWLAEQN